MTVLKLRITCSLDKYKRNHNLKVQHFYQQVDVKQALKILKTVLTLFLKCKAFLKMKKTFFIFFQLKKF